MENTGFYFFTHVDRRVSVCFLPSGYSLRTKRHPRVSRPFNAGFFLVSFRRRLPHIRCERVEVGKQYRIFPVEHGGAAVIRVARGQFNTTAPSSQIHRNHVRISMYETICIIVDGVYDNFRSQTPTRCDIARAFSSPFFFRFFSFSTYQFLCRPSRKFPVTSPTPVPLSFPGYARHVHSLAPHTYIIARNFTSGTKKKHKKVDSLFSVYLFSTRPCPIRLHVRRRC